MTTITVIFYVLAVAFGGAILGWCARARQTGSFDTANQIDRGEVGGPNNGD